MGTPIATKGAKSEILTLFRLGREELTYCGFQDQNHATTGQNWLLPDHRNCFHNAQRLHKSLGMPSALV